VPRYWNTDRVIKLSLFDLTKAEALAHLSLEHTLNDKQ
jgi:hypothetical protein